MLKSDKGLIVDLEENIQKERYQEFGLLVVVKKLQITISKLQLRRVI